jgi:glycosyltransferase involved in cell wall biosynthesis
MSTAPDARRRFLLIAPIFPPHGSSGVQRTAKLAIHAPAAGWDPLVLAMRKPPSRSFPRDEGLARDVAHLHVERLRRIELRYIPRAIHTLGFHTIGFKFEWLFPLDGFVGWLPFAIRRAEALLKSHRPEVIYTTSSPFSAHLVGLYMKRKHGLPWIADYRDPWTTCDLYPEYNGDTPLSRHKLRMDRAIERLCLAEADHSTVVVDTHKHDIVATLGADPERTHVVYNGYDEDDFAGAPYPLPPHGDVFRVTYIGNFYRGRTAKQFLPMWRAFLNQPGVDRSRVRLRLVGESSDWMKRYASLWEDIADTVECEGYVPHDEVLGQMQQTTVLLILFPRVWAISGKLFEYLRSGLPVLGLAPERGTMMEEMLNDAGVGHVVTEHDVDGGTEHLRALYAQWANGDWTLAPNIAAVTKFTRRVQAERFAALFARAAEAPRTR